MSPLAKELRYALRTLRKRPAFAATAILTLGLGIGASSVIFSVVNAVLWRPLSYPEPEELVAVYTRFLPTTGYDFPYFGVSGPELLDIRERVPALSATAAYFPEGRNLVPGRGPAERVEAVVATAELFEVLRAEAAFGRTFARGDDLPGAPCVTVLGFGFWRQRLQADRAVLGRDVLLDGVPCEIVGVMPRGFGFPDDRTHLYTPLALDTAAPGWHRQSHNFLAVARRAQDATAAQVEAQLDALHEQWATEFPDHYATGHFAVQRSLHDDLIGGARQPLLLVFGAVGLVLLMICANLANLLLARGESQRHEMAIRTALGASRRRLIRQLAVEHLVLGLAGGGVGLLLAGPLLRGLLALESEILPRVAEVGLDLAAVCFSLGVSIVAAFAFGFLPAFQSTAVGALAISRSGDRSVSAGRIAARRGLVVAEVALSLLLVAGATLLVRSYQELRSVDVGLRADGVLTFGLFAPEEEYPELAQVRRLHAELQERLRSAPGIRAAGAISNLPLWSEGPADDFTIEGRPLPSPGEPQWNARYLVLTAGTFETLGVSLRRGRRFDERDVDGSPLVAIVNEAAARAYWPGDDPLGRRIRYHGVDDQPWLTIVGVVGDVRQLGPAEPAPPIVYVPHAQPSRLNFPYGRFMTVVVRGDSGPEDLVGTVRGVVRGVAPSLPMADVRGMRDVVDRATGQPRFTMLLMLAFAVVALLLGVLGIYGVLAYAVEQRRREIGVRMALGATRREVTALVVRQGMSLAAVGAGIGLAGALAARRVLQGILFNVDARDPVTLAAVTLALLGVSFLACYLPARRAARVDPMIALRTE
ncbi:MAG: ABC transporter permease [Thermoanaerobaculia bacterium]